MTTFIAVFIGALTGVLSGIGIGGGSLLVLYLTLFAGMGQYQAGGTNLLYFIACAPAALVCHVKNKLVDTNAMKWCVIAGIPISIAAAYLASSINVDWLRRLFGIFLLYIGIKELFAKPKDAQTNKKPSC